jgi:hypothetical protein
MIPPGSLSSTPHQLLGEYPSVKRMTLKVLGQPSLLTSCLIDQEPPPPPPGARLTAPRNVSPQRLPAPDPFVLAGVEVPTGSDQEEEEEEGILPGGEDLSDFELDWDGEGEVGEDHEEGGSEGREDEDRDDPEGQQCFGARILIWILLLSVAKLIRGLPP